MMGMSGRTMIGGAIGLLGLVAGGSGSIADSIDARVLGAWTTSQPDCKRGRCSGPVRSTGNAISQ